MRNNDRGGATTEVVPTKVSEGTNLSACFNPNYLADAFTSLEAGDLKFCFNGPLKPAILRTAAVLGHRRDRPRVRTQPKRGGAAFHQDRLFHREDLIPHLTTYDLVVISTTGARIRGP